MKLLIYCALIFTVFHLPFSLYSRATDPPTISSLAPTSGPVGTTVLITGTNFDEVATNNIVIFGATQATVVGATSTEIEVVVPSGANYQSLTVLVNGLLAYAPEPFVVTFESEGIVASSFDTKLDFPTGTDPTELAISDLDGDGKPDLVVLNRANNSASIFRNTTSNPGQINYDTKIDYTTGLVPIAISTGDLDGDGKMDLVVANYNSSTISIFENTSSVGNISFKSKLDFQTGLRPRFVAIGDFDLDGKADLAVVNDGNHTVSVYRNTSTGPDVISYAAQQDFATGLIPKCVALGDLDGDGKTDLVIANWNTNNISILRNESSGMGNINYAPKSDYFTGSNPASVSVGDLDGDGKIDLAVSNFNGNSISILRNTSSVSGEISYTEKFDYPSISGPSSIDIDDLDGDGRLDLFVPNRTTNVVSVFMNTSTTSETINFATNVDFPTASAPFSASSGDLDGDGRTDIALVNFEDHSLSIFRNTNTAAEITSFSFSEQTGIAIIDSDQHSITVEVAHDTDLTGLVSTYILSAQASASIGSASQLSGVTANDFSSTVTYTVTAGDGISVKDWSVLVNVKPNEPPSISNMEFTIDENVSLGTVLGDLVATDPENDVLTFSILSGNESGAFQVDANSGQLSINDQDPLDFEINPTFELTVEVSDGELTDTSIISIDLNNVNESPSILNMVFTVDENVSVGTVLGDLEATDPENDALTFSILSGNENEAFQVDANSGQLSVNDNEPLNFEINPTFELTVEVSDGDLTDTSILSIDLNNINDSPIILPSTFIINEQPPIGAFVGQVEASDEDGDQLLFSIISGDESEAFEINENTGELKVLDPSSLKFKISNSIELEVEASDGELNNSAIITVNLNEIATEPVGIDDEPVLWKIYPNPVLNKLTIEWHEFEYVVIKDLSGREVLSSKGRELDLAGLPAGVYVLTLIGKGNKDVKSRILKK